MEFNRNGDFLKLIKVHKYKVNIIGSPNQQFIILIKVSDFNSYEETLEDFFKVKEPVIEDLKVEIGVMGGPGAADENNVLRGINLSDSWTINGNLIE